MRVYSLLVVLAFSVSSTAMAQTATKASTTTVRHTAATPGRVDAGMNNAAVIKLVKVGLSDDVVINSITNATKKSFDLTTDGLVELKLAGVSDRIIVAMQGKSSPPAAPTGLTLSTTTPKVEKAVERTPTAAVHEPGIYVAGESFKQLEPSVFSQAKTGGMFANALTYGIKKIKFKAVVRSAHADQRVSSGAEFYFYFEKTNSGLGNSGGFAGFMQQATSPNEFVLARLTVDDKERSIVMGEAGFTGMNTGTRSQDVVDFKIEKVSPGVYKVIPSEKLEPGEYAFFYAAGSNLLGAGSQGKLFDFGVDR